jgi:hypothetical protein
MNDQPNNNDSGFDADALTQALNSGSNQATQPTTSELIDKIQALINRHIYFPDPDTGLLIAVWVLGTYMYKEFTYYGYLWVTSATKGSGKTLLLDILAQICHECPGRLSNITEATLFRESNSGKTLILDESENLKTSDKQRFGALMSVLNDGFKQGGQVPRQEPDPEHGGRFGTVYYSTYCPKAFAGLNDVLDTIESRSFKIVMTKKTVGQHIERFNLRLQKRELDELRARIKGWSLVNKPIIGDNYWHMGDTYCDFEGLDDRTKDILEPLAMIAVDADCEVDPPTKIYLPRLLAVVRSMAQQKKSTSSNLTIQVIVNVCTNEFKKSPDSPRLFIPSQIFLEELCRAGETSIATAKALASYMAKLSLHSTSSGELRGYYVTQEWLERLKLQYSSELSEL